MFTRQSLLRLLLSAALGLTLSSVGYAAEPLKIAFVDTGNTGRSLMAEVLGRDLADKGRLFVAFISRGLDVDPFDEAPEANAAILMKRRGFDVLAHRARRLEPSDVVHADLILTMTPAHAEKLASLYPDAKAKIHTLAAYAAGSEEPILDAWGKPMEAYATVVGQLDRYLPLALARAKPAPR